MAAAPGIGTPADENNFFSDLKNGCRQSRLHQTRTYNDIWMRRPVAGSSTLLISESVKHSDYWEDTLSSDL
jgi:hypothetical protein